MIERSQDRRGPIESRFLQGLFLLIGFGDGSSAPRERYTGARPSVYSAALARDQRGGIVTRFNGTSDTIQYADTVALRKPTIAFTLFARARLTSMAPAGAPLGGKRTVPGGGYSWGCEVNNVQVTGYVYNGVKTFIQTSTGPPTGKWLNVFIRWASGVPLTAEAFLDGGQAIIARASSANVSGTIAYSTDPLLFMDDGFGNFHAGDMASLAVWNRRLTDGELLRLAEDPGVLLRRTGPSLAPLAAVPDDVNFQPVQPLHRAGHL
jgi:hypothetical protein